jgi:hypothetical protein
MGKYLEYDKQINKIEKFAFKVKSILHQLNEAGENVTVILHKLDKAKSNSDIHLILDAINSIIKRNKHEIKEITSSDIALTDNANWNNASYRYFRELVLNLYVNK